MEGESTPVFDRAYFRDGENMLASLLPEQAAFSDIVRVLYPEEGLTLYSDVRNDQTLLAWKNG